MRAVLLKDQDLSSNLVLEVDGKQAHHLIKVVRVQSEEQLLVLNGMGSIAEGRILEVTKKIVKIEIINVESKERSYSLDLAFGVPKKEGLEDLIRKASELGIENLKPLQTEFCVGQIKSFERIERIIESGIIQSNNPFFPSFQDEINLDRFLEQDIAKYDYVFLFSMFGESNRKFKDLSISPNDKILLLIGPEGGFSKKEEEKIAEIPNVLEIQLPTPILRSPTAVCAGTGLVLSKFI